MKLEWETNPPKNSMNWDEAIEYAKSLGDGWRLPTRGELCDAYDNFVDGFKKKNYWSSSTYAQDTSDAWLVGFYSGSVGSNDKTYNYYVRCVRDVKGKDIDPLKLDPSCIIIDIGENKMNIEEIQNKIEQLQKELNELKNKMTKPERWKPYKLGYYIDTNGNIYLMDDIDYDYPAPHNCFRTKELAKLRAKQREAEDELFNIWEHLVGDWRPDWNQHSRKNHVVITKGRIEIRDTFDVSFKPQYTYFPTFDLAMRQYELASDHARAYMEGKF